ncbi:hypothetical protein HMPREF0262_03175 [Clostridium sp. ATCC 29733]|nr:hypothetical protein HMPREF0262_03175 [Clostridium sp. ATCC 29733]
MPPRPAGRGGQIPPKQAFRRRAGFPGHSSQFSIPHREQPPSPETACQNGPFFHFFRQPAQAETAGFGQAAKIVGNAGFVGAKRLPNRPNRL